MFKSFKHIIILLICVIFIFNSSNALFAQDEVPPEVINMASNPQPPMRNVFFNVLWGSVAGGLAMAGWSILDDGTEKDERYGLSNITRNFIIGATYGGLLGLFSGVYFSINGIEFDESRSRIAYYQSPNQSIHSDQYAASVPIREPSFYTFKPDEIPIASFRFTF